MKLLLLLIAAVSGHGLGCHPAQFEAGDRCCPMCRPGYRVSKNCRNLPNTLCRPCEEGTFMNESTAQTRCHKCHICEVHSGLKEKTPCTKTSDSVCEPQEGFYCTDAKGNNCVQAQKHRKCEKGQYIKLNGTSSADTECSPCTDGTFSDGTFTQCRPHTQCESLNQQLVNPGTSSTDTECEEKKGLPIGAIVGVILLSIFLVGAGATGFYFFYWRKKKNQTIEERRGEAGFPAETPGEEAIALNPVNTPNIRADEVHSTDETRGTA